MDSASDGRAGGALRRRLGTGVEDPVQREGRSDVAGFAVGRPVLDELRSSLRRPGTEEQVEPSQRHDEPHGS